MKITLKLVNELINNLACVAISANGGVPENGLTEEQRKSVEEYARTQFQEIMDTWEDILDENWEIV